MNSVLVVADLMVTAHPVRFLHFLHPMALGIIYTLFSFVYFCAGGTNRSGSTSIYPFLNWDKPLVSLLGFKKYFEVLIYLCTYYFVF